MSGIEQRTAAHAREERRKAQAKVAYDRAYATFDRSHVCTLGNCSPEREHPTCAGVTGRYAGPWGCMCPCHDATAAATLPPDGRVER